MYSPGAGYEGAASDPVVENADFFNYSEGSNGASGVGCGKVVNLPATCRLGAGYWATEQSCTIVDGMVGAKPTTPISGTLYKCTAPNTWTASYRPYSYPHPMAGAGPSAPRNLRITGE